MADLEVSTVERVMVARLNRPEKKNAINDVMFDELLQVFTEVRDNPADRVLVLTGAGGAFCSGADLSGRAAADPDAPPVHQLTRMNHVADVALALGDDDVFGVLGGGRDDDASALVSDVPAPPDGSTSAEQPTKNAAHARIDIFCATVIDIVYCFTKVPQPLFSKSWPTLRVTVGKPPSGGAPCG